MFSHFRLIFQVAHSLAGIMAMEALHQKVLPFILRRMKGDVLKDLPPKITQVCYFRPLCQSILNKFIYGVSIQHDEHQPIFLKKLFCSFLYPTCIFLNFFFKLYDSSLEIGFGFSPLFLILPKFQIISSQINFKFFMKL